jgi:thiamine pyrophosphate-dependent acetolactate synthase large subunit-like protein
MTTATAVTAAEATAAELDALGVEHLFLMTGRDNTLWIALQKAGIRQVLARTEAAAVYMADGYARVTGRPTFVYGGYGPGAANVAASLAEPFWSSSPVVAMCSAMRRTERYRGEYQELDQPKMFEPVTKWAIEAANASQLPRLIRQAAHRSLTGTPGPVYLGVPGDIYEDAIASYSPPQRQDALSMPLTRPAPTPADAERAVKALLQAERPMIVAGNGIHQSAAWDELRAFAERLGVPVVTSVAGKGAIAETHPLAMGTVGRYSRVYGNVALKSADVVLAIGTRLGGMVTNSFKLLDPSAYLIHVTLEPDAIGQNFQTDLGVVSDARSFLEVALGVLDGMAGTLRANGKGHTLTEYVATNGNGKGSGTNGHSTNGHATNGNGHSTNGHSTNGHGANGNGHSSNGHVVTGEPLTPTELAASSPWLAALIAQRQSWRERRIALASQDGTDGRPMRPEAVMAALEELMADDSIVCADTGYASAWPGGLLDLRRSGRRFFRADGSLGWAFAGAMGAQMAAPNRQVVAVIGDGGFGYQVADLETAARIGLPVVTVILNNQTLAFEAHVQTLLYDHFVPEVDDFLDVDYAKVARAFGATGVRVTNAPDLRRALTRALKGDGPTVIDAVIDREAIAPVTRYDTVRSREL